MCKMAHFGNCDPETADQEYCIFHKPNKSEEEAREFYREFLERFKPKVEEIAVNGKKVKRLIFEKPIDARGFVFPEIPDVPIEYTDKECNEWNQRFTFENAVFESHANFYQATFEGLVSFEKAKFEKFVCFAGVTFHRFASFDMASFKFQTMNITGNKLIQLSNELNTRYFNVFEFSVSISEHMGLLPGTVFSKAVFNNGASFCEVNFKGIVDFRSAEFKVSNGDELFRYSKCHNLALTGATFNKATFEYAVFDRTRFHSGSEFNNVEAIWLSFKGCHFGVDMEVPSLFRDSHFGEVDFSNSKFKGFAVFTQTEFKGTVDFSKVKFDGSEGHEVAFNGAKFYAEANFHKAGFSVGVNFSDAHFFGKAKFWECTFEKRTEFYRAEFKGEETSFARATFKETVHFDFAEFRKAIFNFAVFEKGASFKNTTFHGNVWFKEVEFKKAVEFQAAEFKEKATFNGSVFERLAVFVNEERTLDEPTPKFHDELSFANCDFRQGANFLGRRLKNETNLSKLWEFFSSRFPNPQAMIEALRVQRLSFEKEGKRDEADRMFVLEMRTRRELRLLNSKKHLAESRGLTKLKAYFEYLGTWLGVQTEKVLADWITQYGTSWRRILMSSGAVIFIMGLVYWIFSMFSEKVFLGIPVGTIYTCERCATGGVSDLLNALYYSLVTFTTLGYGDMHPTGWLKALSAIEALTGAVFMALIVAVIARKWMR